MKRNAIYSPLINTPQNWEFQQVLLYWDNIYSIVPLDHLQEMTGLPSHMREAIGLGIVKPLHPGQHLDEISDFRDSFLNLLDAGNQTQGIHNPANRDRGRPVKVHMEKLDTVAEDLVRRGFAKIGVWPWYEVQSDVANLFMTSLAVRLGQIDSINARPVTDDSNCVDLLFGSIVKAESKGRANAREFILRKLMPLPQQIIPAQALQEFKLANWVKLSRFREAIEEESTKAAALNNEVDQDDYLEMAVRRLDAQKQEIAEAINLKWGGVRFATVAALLSSVLSLATHSRLGIISAAFSTVSGIVSLRDDMNERSRAISQPMAYAAFLESSFTDTAA